MTTYFTGWGNAVAVALAVVLAMLFAPGESFAGYIWDLDIFSNNGGYSEDSRVKLKVVVSSDDGRARFEFRNQSEVTCSITDVYFDDGSLLGIAAIEQSAGVSFSQSASPPNMPQGQNVEPPFKTTQGFSADSDSPIYANGVNADQQGTEWVAILFDLVGGAGLGDVVGEMNDGTLRVGVHVQGFDDGSSESGVNIPEPAVLILVGAGLVAAVARRGGAR
jgi:hypothetical protein